MAYPWRFQVTTFPTKCNLISKRLSQQQWLESHRNVHLHRHECLSLPCGSPNRRFWLGGSLEEAATSDDHHARESYFSLFLSFTNILLFITKLFGRASIAQLLKALHTGTRRPADRGSNLPLSMNISVFALGCLNGGISLRYCITQGCRPPTGTLIRMAPVISRHCMRLHSRMFTVLRSICVLKKDNYIDYIQSISNTN